MADTVTWGMAIRIIRRHNAMVFRICISVLALVFAWACVWLRWHHQGVVSPHSYHPLQYHGCWQALLAIHSAFLGSSLCRFLAERHFYALYGLFLLYLAANIYCVKALFDTKFGNFRVFAHIL